MKKVICFPFIGDSFGGSHQSSLVIIKSLKKKGLIQLLSYIKQELYKQYSKKKKLIFTFPLNIFFGSSNNKYLNLINLIFSIPVICYLILKYKIDIIHSNDMKIHINWILPSFSSKKKIYLAPKNNFP